MKTFNGQAGPSRRAALSGGLALAAAVQAGVARAQGAAGGHAPSARLLERLNTRKSYQLSVDVPTIELGLSIARAGLAAGIDIIEMGTPLCKTSGVANVVPAFRKAFPNAILLADMKTMDGGASEARSVYAGGGNIIDFLALAGVPSAKAICGVRDEYRRNDPATPRLVFSDIIMPNSGALAGVGDIAASMVEAGVDAVGVHLQVDARRADPKLIENDFLGEVALKVYERIGKAVPVQVVGGLNIPQAQRLAKAGLKGFVISGNLGVADLETRYNLPPAEIQALVKKFITEVNAA